MLDAERDRLIAEGRLWRVHTTANIERHRIYEVVAPNTNCAKWKYYEGDVAAMITEWEEPGEYDEEVCYSGIEQITLANKNTIKEE